MIQELQFVKQRLIVDFTSLVLTRSRQKESTSPLPNLRYMDVQNRNIQIWKKQELAHRWVETWENGNGHHFAQKKPETSCLYCNCFSLMIWHKKNTMLSLPQNPYNSKTFQNQDESLVFPSYKWSYCKNPYKCATFLPLETIRRLLDVPHRDVSKTGRPPPGADGCRPPASRHLPPKRLRCGCFVGKQSGVEAEASWRIFFCGGKCFFMCLKKSTWIWQVIFFCQNS